MGLTATDFIGRWVITRQIADALAGPDGAFDGAAVFAPVPEGLSYRETGWLRLGQAAPLKAERGYLWRFGPDGVTVDYADGRPFQHFRFSAPAGEHLCGDDLYRVAYDFAAFPRWSAEWRVTGPRKDYVMRSKYQRAA